MSKTIVSSSYEHLTNWEDGALVFTEGPEELASIRQDPVYGYWAVTGTVEGEFATLQEAKTFVINNVFKL